MIANRHALDERPNSLFWLRKNCKDLFFVVVVVVVVVA